MKFLLGVLILSPNVSAAHLFQRAACAADNCARAIAGTRANSVSRVSTDCVSFQAVTTCPSAITTTITQGSSSAFIPASGCVDTTTTATSVPSYAAKACLAGSDPSSRFASACSCALSTATKTTVTAQTPVATMIVPAEDCQNLQSPYTSNGKTFTKSCGQGYHSFSDEYTIDTATTSFKGCIDLCALNSQCVAISFDHLDVDGYTCSLLSSIADGPYYTSRYDGALLVTQ